MSAECFYCSSDGGPLMVTNTYVGIVKAKTKMKLANPAVNRVALASLLLVGLGSQMSLKPSGGAH